MAVLEANSFHDLCGQSLAAKTLSHQLDTGQIPNALLFVGPPRTGKFLAARLYAAMVMIRFQRPSSEDIAKTLRQISDARAIHVSDRALGVLAQAAAGSLEMAFKHVDKQKPHNRRRRKPAKSRS